MELDITNEVEDIESFEYKFSIENQIQQICTNQEHRATVVARSNGIVQRDYYDLLGRLYCSEKNKNENNSNDLYSLLTQKYASSESSVLCNLLQSSKYDRDKLIQMAQLELERENKVKSILYNLSYYDTAFLKLLSDGIYEFPKMKLGKLIKKIAYDHNIEKYKNEETAQILSEKISPSLKADSSVFYVAKYKKLLTKSVWEKILDYAGNSSSCWRVGGGWGGGGRYEMSSLYMSATIANKLGYATLFFINENDQDRPYIKVDNKKYYLHGRFWTVFDKKINEWVHFNYYNDINNLNESCRNAFLGKDYSKIYMKKCKKAYINNDICYVKKSKDSLPRCELPSPFYRYTSSYGKVRYGKETLTSLDYLKSN